MGLGGMLVKLYTDYKNMLLLLYSNPYTTVKDLGVWALGS